MDNDAVVVADVSGKIQLWNRGAEKLFGYSSADAVGQSLDLIVPEEFRTQHWVGFHHAMKAGAAKAEGQPFELPIACRTGVVTAPGLFVLLRNAKKVVIGAMAIFSMPETTASG